MNYLVDNPDVKITKDGKRHTVTEKLRDVRGAAFEGDKGLDIKGIRKAQFKQFLEELKEKMGIGIVFNQWKDGTTKGYTLIDYKRKTIFKGSDILALDELLNPNWKKGLQKDQVLTADEAYESTQKLIDSPTLASDIYEELTALNLEIYEPDENEMTDIAVNFSNEEQEHRQEAVRIFKQMISEHKEPVDDFQDDYRSICEEGQKAYNHAATAEWLKRLKEERDEREQAKTTDMADDEPSKREKLAWNEVGDYILDYFDSNDIEYNYKPTFEIKINGMDEKKARQLAFEKFEEAIYAHDNGSKNAADIAWEALAYAQVMERLHEDPELINRYVDQQAVDETQPVQAPTYQEEERERETANNHIPKHEDLAGIGERERAQAIDEARETIVSYKNRSWDGLTDDDILSISMGIVARAIERGRNTLDNRAWSRTVTDFKEEVDWSPLYQRKVFNTINDNIVIKYFNGLMAALQQTGLAGGPNNDLPRDKDDQWNLWKSLFGMRPPRQSKGQGVKRK
jgi:ribosome recycling factor